MKQHETQEETIQDLKEQLNEIGLDVMTEGVTLSQLMREGTRVTKQAVGSWGDSVNEACALSAACIAAKARGLIK